MKLKININLDNAAFEGYQREPEIANIFKSIIRDLYLALNNGRCLDHNGNTVGQWTITEAKVDNDIACPECNWQGKESNLTGYNGDLCPNCGSELLH